MEEEIAYLKNEIKVKNYKNSFFAVAHYSKKENYKPLIPQKINQFQLNQPISLLLSNS